MLPKLIIYTNLRKKKSMMQKFYSHMQLAYDSIQLMYVERFLTDALGLVAVHTETHITWL